MSNDRYSKNNYTHEATDNPPSITDRFAKVGAMICGLAAAATTVALEPSNHLITGTEFGAVLGLISGFAVGTEEAKNYRELGKYMLKGVAVGLTGLVGLAGGVGALAGGGAGIMTGSAIEMGRDFFRNRRSVSQHPTNG
jgi:hypothetical protein